ncbi:hypothetical protein BDZ45DRAFT_163469 [Acephala macrosclerotiorum]|nr:hypothetical protein BDZ45DRAFT_163469 [Acephala macrosclerotiorum]
MQFTIPSERATSIRRPGYHEQRGGGALSMSWPRASKSSQTSVLWQAGRLSHCDASTLKKEGRKISMMIPSEVKIMSNMFLTFKSLSFHYACLSQPSHLVWLCYCRFGSSCPRSTGARLVSELLNSTSNSSTYVDHKTKKRLISRSRVGEAKFSNHWHIMEASY